MGTIPDCTGLDHDDFVDPGAEIEIRFERLGTLRCRFAEPARKLLPSRWPLRLADSIAHPRISRATVQRAMSKPSRPSCLQTLRTP